MAFEHQRTVQVKDILILAAIVLLALWVRLDNLLIWGDFADAVMVEGQPLLTNFDGYYYLRLARDIVENNYVAIDSLRAVPDTVSRPFPPPLLSVILAKLVLLTPFSLEWLAVLLPAFLGALIAIPLFGLGWIYSGRVGAYSAALFGSLSHYFVFRTQLGWLDTDCLNVFFPLSITLSLLGFALCKGARRYVFLCGGVLLYALFLLWWDQATQIVSLFFIAPLLLALLLFYRPSFRERYIFYGFLAAALCLVFGYFGWDYFGRVLSRAGSMLSYISKNDSGEFPNIGLTVAEQRPELLSEAIAQTTDSPVVFVLAVAGICMLCWKYPGRSLFLAPYIVIAIFSVLFAKRFMLFLGPVLALGLGVILQAVWSIDKMRTVAQACVIVLVGIMALGWIQREYSEAFLPQIHPELVSGMKDVKHISPPNAVVWTKWAYGYAMNYHGRRATLGDGQIHGGERIVYISFPLALEDYRLAANYMKFYVKRGPRGMRLWYRAMAGDKKRGLQALQEILAAGPRNARRLIREYSPEHIAEYNSSDAWLNFFYPPDSRPVYLFLDKNMDSHLSWFWMATWDVQRRQGIFLSNSNGTKVSTNIRKPPEAMIRMLGSIKEAELLFDKSLFSRLFHGKKAVGPYYTPLAITGFYQIWEVKGDMDISAKPLLNQEGG